MKILLTGFGKFRDVDTNPTMLIINTLEDENWTPDNADRNDISFDVIDVHTLSCDSILKEFTIKIANDPTSNNIIMIHLGVDSNSTNYKLETSAYNNKTFRVPDELGQQPCNETINQNQPLDSILKTNLPLEAINTTLQSEGYNVNLSDDPGRFICNYIYYNSLEKCRETFDSLSSSMSTQNQIYSLFIHVPSENVFPIAQQCVFVKRVVNEIVASISKTSA